MLESRMIDRWARSCKKCGSYPTIQIKQDVNRRDKSGKPRKYADCSCSGCGYSPVTRAWVELNPPPFGHVPVKVRALYIWNFHNPRGIRKPELVLQEWGKV